MTFTTLLLQAAPPTTAWSMLTGATIPTKIVLAVLGAGSLFSWWLIFAKSRQFRDLREQGDAFLYCMERAETSRMLIRPYYRFDSPYGRVFRQGVNFFSELSPGVLREGERPTQGLSLTQLEALRLVLEKEEAEERDELAQGLGWLAVIGSVSPLMGLMGTVIGIMNAFLGITSSGSSNIMAVAPGVAEALLTTVADCCSDPCGIAYNHFVGKVNLVAAELEGSQASSSVHSLGKALSR